MAIQEFQLEVLKMHRAAIESLYNETTNTFRLELLYSVVIKV